MQSLISLTSRTVIKRSTLVAAQKMAFAPPKKTSDKSLGDEKNFINKQEQELLKNLLKKVKVQATECSKTEDQKAADLKALCAKFSVSASDSLIKDLLAWKADK